jgi:DNA repair exonuclease SbcCD ATPase subunit
VTAETVEARIDALYRLDPAEFVEARNALARELKEEGEAAAARDVRALRKPSLAAWALNVVAGEEPERIRELRSAGAELRRAHEAAMAGRKSELREADDRRRTMVSELTEVALERAGENQRERIEATLEAAAVDEGVGEQLSAGRLTSHSSPPSGLADLTDVATSPPGDGGPAPRPDRARMRSLERRIRELERTRDRHREDLARAEERLSDAEAELAAANRHVADTEAALEAARAELDAASR